MRGRRLRLAAPRLPLTSLLRVAARIRRRRQTECERAGTVAQAEPRVTRVDAAVEGLAGPPGFVCRSVWGYTGLEF